MYTLWYGVALGVLTWQLWSANRALRNQFLLALVGCWIVLGTILASALSSVGPCFYALLTGKEEPFAQLMTYLSMVDDRYGLNALRLQDALWASYLDPVNLPFIGIAAMPSLHVAVAVLWVLLARRVHRWLFIGFAAYAVAIFLGSVHLGWHYAIDGYVSAAVVPILWWGAGRAVAWEQRWRTGPIPTSALVHGTGIVGHSG